ncbi:MAG: hypothetical protein PHW96_03790 [Candidatus Nanoarchaeia archaeon]|nr:hypothetical protein [Candidatus Nanoarchaeia archaeon]
MKVRTFNKCHICKGRGFCGRSSCPVYSRFEEMFRTKEIISGIGGNFAGSSPPGVFVGHNMYPKVNVGVLSLSGSSDNAELYDSPKLWTFNRNSINDVIKFRSSLINSRFISDVKKPEKLLDVAQEVACAVKKAEIEVELEKISNPKMVLEPDLIPMGVNAVTSSIRIVSNIHIPRHIDRVVSATDMKSIEGINYLVKKGYDEYLVTKLLSIGNMGIERRLVPTRWAITATDDNIAKQLLKNINFFKDIENYEVYYGGAYGNRFALFLMPGAFEFELYEFWFPGSTWIPENSGVVFSTDYESTSGRKNYASNCGGGYYASKLPIVQMLNERKRRAKVLIVREVSAEYWCPLGVWVVREGVRKALGNKKSFSTFEEAMNYMKGLMRIKFDEVRNSSRIIHSNQRSLFDF